MPKVKISKKQDRFEQILGLLKSRSSWTTSELRKIIGTSQRTLMRDLSDLAQSGVAIETERGRGGGIRLSKNWGLGKLSLSAREITDLLLAITIMEKMESPLLMSNLRSIRFKLYRSFPIEQRESFRELAGRIFVRQKASEKLISSFTGISDALSTPVQKAFFEKRILTLTYTAENGSRSTRRIEPYYLIVIWPLWYLQAWDFKSEAIRFFRIDRIASAYIEKENFELTKEVEFKKLAEQFFEQI